MSLQHQSLIVSFLFSYILLGQGFIQNDPQIHYDEPEGLFDSDFIRDIHIYFENDNYHNVLVNSFFNTPSYRIPATISMGGLFMDSVGVRYKGNSTFCLPYEMGNPKLPYNLDFNYWVSSQKLMGYKKVKLANAWLDPTFVKEYLGAQIYRKYLPSPEVNLMKLYVQDDYLGLYVNTESINKQFLEKHFDEKSGVLFKCDPAGMFCGDQVEGEPNLVYLGGDSLDYYNSYDLKSDTGWVQLIELIHTLNYAPANLGQILNIDRVLWAFAVNTVLANFDTYNGYYVHNYYLYQTEDGLFQMIPWDLSESFVGALMGWSFFSPSDVYEFDPYLGSDASDINNSRPLLTYLLNEQIYRMQYTAHIRTIIEESLEYDNLADMIDQIQILAYPFANADVNQLFGMNQYSANVQSSFWADWGFAGILSTVNERKSFLLSHPEIASIPPNLGTVSLDNTLVSIQVENADQVDFLFTTSEFNSKFIPIEMNDEGINGDVLAGDGLFSCPIPEELNGDEELKFYFRANNNQAMVLSPERAEYEFYIYSKNLGLSFTPFSTRKLLNIVDVLGRKCEPNSNQILFYLYDDGSVDKKWLFE